MKFILYFFLPVCFCTGCKNRELPSQYLSSIPVVREAEIFHKPVPPREKSKPSSPLPLPESTAHYHIIVSSFGTNEKAQAEKLTLNLKNRNYPASLLYTSNRYRVSIESFPTQAEAQTAQKKYETLLNRQDLWIHKTK